MKRRRDLTSLIQFLREQGVTEYSTPELSLKLGPIPVTPVEPQKPQQSLTLSDLPIGEAVRIAPQLQAIQSLTDEEMLFWSTT